MILTGFDQNPASGVNQETEQAVSAALRGAYSSFPRLYHTLFSWPHYSALFPPVNNLGKEEKSLWLLLSKARMQKEIFVRKNGENGKIRHPNRLGCLIFRFCIFTFGF